MSYDSYVDKAEVEVEPADNERLVALLNEADEILSKYPLTKDYSIMYVTAMSRAKGFVRDAAKWCSYLHVKGSEVV